MYRNQVTRFDSEGHVPEPKTLQVKVSLNDEDYFQFSETRERINIDSSLNVFSDNREYQEFMNSTLDWSPSSYENRRELQRSRQSDDDFLNEIQLGMGGTSLSNQEVSFTNYASDSTICQMKETEAWVFRQNKTQNRESNWIKEEITISDTIDKLVGSPKTPKSYKTDLAVRKDVVNKNLLRIISRYFKSILTTQFPDFVKSFKSADKLDKLLSELYRVVFNQDPLGNMKYILGAFILAPKMKILSIDPETSRLVSMIHKTLSKYTHKDLEMLYEIGELKELIACFLSKGSEFLRAEEVVQKHSSVYFLALDQLQTNFKLH